MSKFLSGREREFKVGIVSYSESNTVLQVVGNSNFTGIVTAGYFYGDGSNLTNLSGIAATVAISTTAPVSPTSGDLWYNSNKGRTFVYYNDGSSSQWVDTAPFNQAYLDALSGIGFSAGIATDPSIYYTGTPTTGIFFPASDQVTVVSAGSSILNINSSGIDVTGIVTASSFVGNLTGSATGLTGTPDITVGTLTASTVSIAGTLTYDDVTNIDSVGLITARSGIIATGIVTATSFETTKGGTGNFFAGYEAGLTADANSDYNVVIGYQAGYDLASSDYNVAIGYQALYDTSNNNTFGNVAIGYRTLYNAETGDYNIAIGYDVQQYLTTGSHNIALGNRSQSGNFVTGTHNISFGYQSLYTISSGTGNIGLGAYSGQGIYTGSYNTLLGYYAGYALNTPQNYNTFVGAFAGQNVDGGDYMVALGYNAGSAAEGDQSVFIGANAGSAAVNTFGSIYVGYQAGYDSEGSYNVAMGYQSMYDIDNGGSYNVALGYQSLFQESSNRDFNIAIGYRALFGDASASTGDYNIALGREAGELLTTGSGNVFLGSYAGDNVTTGSNNIVIKASQSDYADIDTTTSNQLWIGYDDKSWITGDTNNVGLNYGGNLRLETTGYGVSVYNTLQAPQLNITGVVTATAFYGDGSNLSNIISGVGIQSAGTVIGTGFTTLNFIGAGNTFAVNGTTVDISISGGGGGGGASVSIGTEAPTSPSAGDLWFNNNLGRTFIYYDEAEVGAGSTAVWIDAAPFNYDYVSTPGKSSSTITATDGQTSFSVSYTAGYIDVFLNGIRLNSAEYIATNGTSITLLQGASAGDVLDVVEYRMGIGDTGPQGPAAALTIGTRSSGAVTQNISGIAFTVSLRSGIGTVTI